MANRVSPSGAAVAAADRLNRAWPVEVLTLDGVADRAAGLREKPRHDVRPGGRRVDIGFGPGQDKTVAGERHAARPGRQDPARSGGKAAPRESAACFEHARLRDGRLEARLAVA